VRRIDTDPDWPDPDHPALDADSDPDPDPAKANFLLAVENKNAVLWIRPLGPDPQHCIFIFYRQQEVCPFVSSSKKPFSVIMIPGPLHLSLSIFTDSKPNFCALFLIA
jgi:hypothetical protein